MLLSAEHICKNYGSRQILEDVSFYLREGDKTGIIGINGTGKSTLLKILAGAEPPDSGTLAMHPGLQLSFLAQNPAMDPGNTVLEQVFAGFPADLRELNEYEARTILTKLGITDTAQKIGSLSGGQRKRVALATVLTRPGDVLLLDEPTNHLDTEAVAWLEDWLQRFRGAVVMVTHDRYFLMRVVSRIVEVDKGALYSCEAGYETWLEQKARRLEDAEAAERKRQTLLRHETAWIQRGAKARTTKAKGRIQAYEALQAQAAPEYDQTVSISAASSRLGKKILSLEAVSKSFDGHTVLQSFSYTLLRNDRIGIVGRNGVGKSTLLNLIAGRLAPDSGEIDMGSTVKIGYFRQESGLLPQDVRVIDWARNISDHIVTPDGTFTASQMLERFLFTPDLQYTQISRLSGGEQRRLYLLGVLLEAPNVLLLDEPTNDLDIATMTALEDWLLHFPGAILTVSHDRYFLDKLAASIFELRDGGVLTRYTGNYSDYLEKRPPEETPERAEKQKKPAAPREKPAPKLKFTFKEQREYETIDDTIAALEARLQENEAETAQAASDYVRLEQLMAEHAALEQELEEKTERWVYLNELAEKIAAQKG